MIISKKYISLLFLLCCFLGNSSTFSQVPFLKLSDAIQLGLENYNSIKAKKNYLKASESLVINAQKQFLPDVTAAIQNNYGTANGQFGSLYPYRGVGMAAAGPSSASQNWNTAFGALYASNVNWDVYTFGRLKASVDVAHSQVSRDSLDLQQEKFNHAIKITAAYFNLLAAQKFVEISKQNYKRVAALREVIKARTTNGLNAGVDSSIANAEVSNAKLGEIEAQNIELQATNQLATLLNTPTKHFQLDTLYFSKIPEQLGSTLAIENNPTLLFVKSRINIAENTQKLLSRNKLPVISVFGSFQSKASGFDYDYSPTNNHVDKNYFSGIAPSRSNFIIGAGMFWNFMSPTKINHQIKAQQFISEGLKSEYDLMENQLKSQMILADQRIENALLTYKESPIQLDAARIVYEQKAVLYKNGLSNIIDLTQALFVLNRAETNISVAYANVWQALVLKAASNGDIDLLIKQAR
jgi:outer membrane protein TolC